MVRECVTGKGSHGKYRRNAANPYDSDMESLLEIRALTVELATAAGWVKPVNEVSLRLARGEALGLVGESGSGKTMLSLALMGLLPPGARVKGEIRWRDRSEELTTEVQYTLRNGTTEGRNLVGLSDEEWRQVRGREIAMIFQEPMTSLNPVMRIGAQIEEAILAHEPGMNKDVLHRRLTTAMEQAAIPEPELRAQQFPHQLSGGLRQRAMIAMALAPRPNLLIADEPTTALDVTVQKQILDLLDHLRRDLALGLLFITHDLGVVAKVADRVAVMYAGRIVEEGPTCNVLERPKHPYTQGLLAASPALERRELTPIPGTVPQLTELPPGCAFAPRCGYRRAECERVVPELRKAEDEHEARCVLIHEGKEG
jgi:oligopeptide/dipeptide ABC transporter ATP-binding protein